MHMEMQQTYYILANVISKSKLLWKIINSRAIHVVSRCCCLFVFAFFRCSIKGIVRMECRLHVDIFFLETELCHVEINHVEASIKWKRKKNVVIAIATATAMPISITWRFFSLFWFVRYILQMNSIECVWLCVDRCNWP